MHNRYHLAAGLLLGAVSPLLLAQESIQPVVVTATRYAYTDTTAPYASEVYTAQDIARSGATTLYDFLSHDTSINVLPSSGNPFTQKIDMRGYGIGDGYQNIVVTVDGRRLNNIDMVPQLLSSIPLTSIARIEITKGSGSVMYGDGATAGAIHIYTRDMNGGAVTMSAGNHGVSTTSLTAGINNDKAAFTASADNYHQDGFSAADVNGHTDEGNSNNAHALLKLFPTDAIEVRVGGGTSRIENYYPGVLSLAQFNADPGQSNGATYTHQLVRTNDTTLGLTTDIDERWKLTVDHNGENKTTASNGKGSYGTWTYDAAYNYQSDDVALHYVAPAFHLTAGAQAFDGSRHTPASSYAVANKTEKNNAGYYLQGALSAGSNTYSAGVRREQVKYSYIPRTGSSLNASHDLSAYDLGINHRVDAKISLFANYNMAFEAPDIDRFFAYDSSGNVIFNGFISPAYARTLSLGLNRVTTHNKLKLTTFYAGLTNEIYYYAISSYSGTNTNIDRSHKYGFDLQDNHVFNDRWSAGVNYTYTRAIIDTENSGGGAYNGKNLPGVPTHNVTASLTYKPSERSSLTLSDTYRSECYAADDFANNLAQKQAAYQSTDLNYSYHLQKMELFAKVENLFGHANGEWIKNDNIYPVNFTTNWLIGLRATF